jgi:transcription elongation factor Elf1
MKIQKILSVNRIKHELQCIFRCEFCNYMKQDRAFDDEEYLKEVLPTLPCPKCGKRTKDEVRT